jgi:hypothetical protein
MRILDECQKARQTPQIEIVLHCAPLAELAISDKESHKRRSPDNQPTHSAVPGGPWCDFNLHMPIAERMCF